MFGIRNALARSLRGSNTILNIAAGTATPASHFAFGLSRFSGQIDF